ncbi:hypothetical protein B7494_g4839 [Chlorociboria aeruginascens]|nr:hypothetical protein B7494_g4839 [Chlorociboria aeruginascens]
MALSIMNPDLASPPQTSKIKMALRITNPDPASPPPRDPSQPKERKTFGVEIEFMLATLEDHVEDLHPEEGRTVRGLGGRWTGLYDHIATTLKAAGIPTIIDKGDKGSYSWTVTDDVSLFTSYTFGYKWISVEIISPPYYFEHAALDKVAQVVSVLKSTYRIVCDESCGVHIHIGDGLRGLEDDTLRLLFAMLWTFEPQLDTLHPAERVGIDAYSGSLRSTSWLGYDQINLGRVDPKQGLEEILKATTNAEIVRLMEHKYRASGYVDRVVYNISNMKKPYLQEFVKRTIEFRQHESTLDPIRITNWITVCHGLVEFCDTIETSRIEKFLRQHIDESPEEYSIIQMLNDIGLSPQADFYASRLTKHPLDPISGNDDMISRREWMV